MPVLGEPVYLVSTSLYSKTVYGWEGKVAVRGRHIRCVRWKGGTHARSSAKSQVMEALDMLPESESNHALQVFLTTVLQFI